MDSAADFLSQINNAYRVGKKEMVTSWSNFREILANLMKSKGYFEEVSVVKGDNERKRIELILKYGPGGRPSLTKIKRVSKPGRRFYVSADEIPWPPGGLGDTIVSTPLGLMVGKEARKKNLGGEVICQIFS
ncbi:MAG: 30S ribosomal protein S8 [Patescibacteria group bacterium]|nr:30S ribosomal protein S8 [Patescibacteria group bacterium]